MPTYESAINKDKTPNKILSKLENRLRSPFMLDMETELSAISDLIFALQSEMTSGLKKYTNEVIEVRSQMLMNKEFMSRRELAKLLAGLLSPANKLGILKAVENFRKMPMFKSEMEKPCNFITRQDSNNLLPNERKPNFAANLTGIKKFYVKSLAQPESKKQAQKPEQKTDQKKSGFKQKSGFRGRGRGYRPYFVPRQMGPYGNQYYNPNNFGFQPQGYQMVPTHFDPRFHGPGQSLAQNQPRQGMSNQKLNDLRNRNCFHCHQPGHQTRNCPVKNSQNSQANPAKK